MFDRGRLLLAVVAAAEAALLGPEEAATPAACGDSTQVCLAVFQQLNRDEKILTNLAKICLHGCLTSSSGA